MFSVFKNINNLAGKSKLLDAVAIFCARYFLYLMLGVLFIFSFVINNWRIFFVPFLSGLFAAFIVSRAIYLFYLEKRPAELKSTTILIPVPKNPSFPSRHALLLFGISFCVFFYNEQLAIIFLICSCFVGMARVFCGVHWFRDIIAGAFIGFLSAIAVYSLLNYLNF
jgi:undecaprenyl-diphosphatase